MKEWEILFEEAEGPAHQDTSRRVKYMLNAWTKHLVVVTDCSERAQRHGLCMEDACSWEVHLLVKAT